MRAILFASVATAALGFSSFAQAQDNLQKLGAMQSTGTTSADFKPVEQTGEYADQLRANLENVEVPDGFKIELFEIVPDVRWISMKPATM